MNSNNKKKYKVVGDSKNTFSGIELDIVVNEGDTDVGKKFALLGGEFTVTQNGMILVLVDKEWCLSIMDITPPEVVEKPKLVVNDTLEVFMDNKEIEVKVDCTYEELYYVLADEWKLIQKLGAGVVARPFEYNTRMKLFTFLDNWGFVSGSLQHMKDGSYSRKNSAGRNI